MRPVGLVLGCALWAGSSPAMAEDMACGTHVIVDEEESGPSKTEVSEKCGAPLEVAGDDWFYRDEGGARYRLHFNDDGMLESISVESTE